MPQSDWAVTHHTHPPLIDQAIYEPAQCNLGRGQRLSQTKENIRKSIFAGLVFCARCGHSLCSCGTVYKGEREKYWYLSCTHQRGDIANRCDGVRIKYADLVEVVRRDLNELLALDDEQAEALARAVTEKEQGTSEIAARQARLQQAQARLLTIDKIVTKLYTDNDEGRLDDDRLTRMVQALEQESASHQLDAKVEELDSQIKGCVRGIDPPCLSLPGIGELSVAVILSEFGDFSKFQSPSKMLSFAGLEPGYFQPGQSEFTGHMVKHGSSQLRCALMN